MLIIIFTDKLNHDKILFTFLDHVGLKKGATLLGNTGGTDVLKGLPAVMFRGEEEVPVRLALDDEVLPKGTVALIAYTIDGDPIEGFNFSEVSLKEVTSVLKTGPTESSTASAKRMEGVCATDDDITVHTRDCGYGAEIFSMGGIGLYQLEGVIARLLVKECYDYDIKKSD
jgi:hypothetical protein